MGALKKTIEPIPVYTFQGQPARTTLIVLDEDGAPGVRFLADGVGVEVLDAGGKRRAVKVQLTVDKGLPSEKVVIGWMAREHIDPELIRAKKLEIADGL